jgi:hypothetical protein
MWVVSTKPPVPNDQEAVWNLDSWVVYTEAQSTYLLSYPGYTFIVLTHF